MARFEAPFAHIRIATLNHGRSRECRALTLLVGILEGEGGGGAVLPRLGAKVVVEAGAGGHGLGVEVGGERAVLRTASQHTAQSLVGRQDSHRTAINLPALPDSPSEATFTGARGRCREAERQDPASLPRMSALIHDLNRPRALALPADHVPRAHEAPPYIPVGCMLGGAPSEPVRRRLMEPAQRAHDVQGNARLHPAFHARQSCAHSIAL